MVPILHAASDNAQINQFLFAVPYTHKLKFTLFHLRRTSANPDTVLLRNLLLVKFSEPSKEYFSAKARCAAFFSRRGTKECSQA